LTRVLVGLWLTLIVAGGARAAVEEVDAATLHQGDRVRVVLRQGGELVGSATALDERLGQLHVRVDHDTLRVDTAIIDWVELLERWDPRPLARISEAVDEEEARQRRARAHARAAGLAVGSFFLPGLGQFALGQQGLATTYLVGTLVVDVSIVLSIVINQNPFMAVILGVLDIAARITSASLAARRANTMAIWVAPRTGGAKGTDGFLIGICGTFPRMNTGGNMP
jgi:hypothetical protein